MRPAAARPALINKRNDFFISLLLGDYSEGVGPFADPFLKNEHPALPFRGSSAGEPANFGGNWAKLAFPAPSCGIREPLIQARRSKTEPRYAPRDHPRSAHLR